jgi:transcriptional regulator with XRE-family HTH domain
MSSTIANSTTQSMWTHVASKRRILVKEYRQEGMTKAKPNLLLGRFVQHHRKAAELTVPEAAEAAGVNASFWRKLEHGQYESPSPKMLAPIARVIDAPLADIYGLAGYETTTDLPSFTPYLRSKYNLTPKALAELERYFEHLRSHYGIPADQPVFPPSKRAAGKPGRRPGAQPQDPAWKDESLTRDLPGAAS